LCESCVERYVLVVGKRAFLLRSPIIK
jgi:hypothetical protein